MEEMIVSLEKLFSYFSSNYKLKERKFKNQIQFRRLQNSIQQISEYRIAINELLKEYFKQGKPRVDDFDTLLKLLFEYVALTDTIMRYSTDFLKVDIDSVKDLIIKLFEDIPSLAEPAVKDKYDTEIINNMNRMKDDVFSLIKYWGQ